MILTSLILGYGQWFSRHALLKNYRDELESSFVKYDSMQSFSSEGLTQSVAVETLALGNRIHLLSQRIVMEDNDDALRWRHAEFLKKHVDQLEQVSRDPIVQIDAGLVNEMSVSKELMARFRVGLLDLIASSSSMLSIEAKLLQIQERIEARRFSVSQIEDLLSQLSELLDQTNPALKAMDTSPSISDVNIEASKESGDRACDIESTRRRICRLLGFLCLDSAWANADRFTPHLAKDSDVLESLERLQVFEPQFVRHGLRGEFYFFEYLLNSQLDTVVGPLEDVYFEPGYEDSLSAILKLTHDCLIDRREQVVIGINDLTKPTTVVSINQTFVRGEICKQICRFAVSKHLRDDSLAAEGYGAQIQLALDLAPDEREVNSLLWWLSMLCCVEQVQVPGDVADSHRHLIDATRVSPSSSLFISTELIRAAFDGDTRAMSQASETSSLLNLTTDGILANVAIWRSNLGADSSVCQTWVDLLRFASDRSEKNRRSNLQLLLIASTLWSVQLGDVQIAKSSLAKAERSLEPSPTLEVLRNRVNSMTQPAENSSFSNED